MCGLGRSPNKSLMVACGDGVVVVTTHNVVAEDDVAAMDDVAAIVGVVTAVHV